MNRGFYEQFKDHGPIPRGMYRIEWDFNVARLGKYGYVFRLIPVGHSADSRTGFLMHGDSLSADEAGHASEGCIILPIDVRQQIWRRGDRLLYVTF